MAASSFVDLPRSEAIFNQPVTQITDIEIGKKLGAGNFGEVFKGTTILS